MKKKTYLPLTDSVRTVDARGKVLGRLATEVAVILRGKDKITFAPNKVEGDRVIIIHAESFHVTGKKLDQKVYRSHSGYLGNMKEMKMRQLMIDRPETILEMAIYNMLPKNRLRRELMKRLTIHRKEAPATTHQPKEQQA